MKMKIYDNIDYCGQYRRGIRALTTTENERLRKKRQAQMDRLKDAFKDRELRRRFLRKIIKAHEELKNEK